MAGVPAPHNGPAHAPTGACPELPAVDWSRFSAQQRDVIVAGDGPLGILAGPGSGKTTTLAGRVAYLVGERRVPPTSILAVTFTTAAAAALRARLAGVLGPVVAQVDIRTFHSFGLRVIRTWSQERGCAPMTARRGRVPDRHADGAGSAPGRAGPEA
jgi:UvrD/REP helicase N-terminal domain